MASRIHQNLAAAHQNHQHQNQRGGNAPEGKQKASAGIDGKYRRALEDIGNVVNVRILEGKQQLQINRPITRSFGAQLLANAQAAAAAKPNLFMILLGQKPVAAIPVDGAVGRGRTRAPKKVAVKTKVEKVVDTSTDCVEESKETSESSSSTSYSRSPRKKVHTLTSVLTARSKVACGLNDKPKEFIHDIDAADTEDQLAAVDYVEDIYKFYKFAEHSSRPHDYMDSQVEINAKMRAILVDWLIEVHHKFLLTPETLYLTFYIIDRYLSLETVTRRELQLVGISAMLIASKYEETWAPEVYDFICISDRAYTEEQILRMEKGILNKLEWNLTVPTPYMFLERFLKAALCDKEDKQMEHMVFFFAELSLMQYSMIMYCPSMIAASAVYAARCTLKKTPFWTATLKHHTGFSEPQLLDCTKILVNSHSAAPDSKLKVVYNKYSSEKFVGVALLPPATQLL